MEKEIIEKLDKLVYQKTKPFCYDCYHVVPTKYCPKCHSDDFMRLHEGFGCEYGTSPFYSAVLSEIGAEDCQYKEDEDSFMDSLDDIYGETVQVGFLNVSTAWAIKQLDPIAFELAMREETDHLLDVGQIVEIDGSYYYTDRVLELIEENLEEVQKARWPNSR